MCFLAALKCRTSINALFSVIDCSIGPVVLDFGTKDVRQCCIWPLFFGLFFLSFSAVCQPTRWFSTIHHWSGWMSTRGCGGEVWMGLSQRTEIHSWTWNHSLRPKSCQGLDPRVVFFKICIIITNTMGFLFCIMKEQLSLQCLDSPGWKSQSEV